MRIYCNDYIVVIIEKMPQQTDHDLLIELRVMMQETLRRLDVGDVRNAKIEQRIATLENFRYFVVGGASILGFIGGIISRYLLGGK